MTTKIKKTIAYFFLGFVTLFLVRLLLGFMIDFEEPSPASSPKSRAAWDASSFRFGLSNYTMVCANSLQQLNGVPLGDAAQFPVDQIGLLEVYTREARIGAQTGDFDEDVARALAIVEAEQGVVRLESAQGIKPNRSFNIVIRVPVDRFDDCVAKLLEIGDGISFSVTKQDKSEEARRQFAERESLRAYVDSLTELRNAEGKVNELADLESRIRDVQKQIRALDVALGEFVKTESYNNINFALNELIPFFVDEEKAPLSAKVAAALVWTTRVYAVLLGLCGVVLLTQLSWKEVRQD